VHPTFYRGVVFWRVNRETFAVIEAPDARGQACATLPAERKGAAFALSGERATSWTTATGPKIRVNRTDESSKQTYTMVIDSARYTLTGDFGSPTHARVFRGPGITLILIGWPMEGCAEFATLYQTAPHGMMRLLGESGSRCHSD
jgi:hypothetical protein